MDLQKYLETYQPFDEEEAGDVASHRQFFHYFGNFAYSRDCLPAHMATLVWVVNPERTKVLMGYHNQFKTFTWFGGHADGEKDLLKNAVKEFEEETGIMNFKILNNGLPFDFVVLSVDRHIKRGKFVPYHLHYGVAYALEVSENENFRIAKEENSAIQWVKNEDVLNVIEEQHLVSIYKRLLTKIQGLGK